LVAHLPAIGVHNIPPTEAPPLRCGPRHTGAAWIVTRPSAVLAKARALSGLLSVTMKGFTASPQSGNCAQAIEKASKKTPVTGRSPLRYQPTTSAPVSLPRGKASAPGREHPALGSDSPWNGGAT
jgi:hypothetical protein